VPPEAAIDPGAYLEGLRVLDFTSALLGPTATLLLRELGAEVIHLGRVKQKGAAHSMAEAMYAAPTSFDKDLVEVDLKRPDGRDVALALAAECDVAVDNFRPGVLARLGLGPDDLLAVNERIVVASASTAGTKSDEVKTGYAPTFAALSGLSAVTGYPDGPPVELRQPADCGAGLVLAVSIMVGLLQRKQTGRGCFVDVSARDGLLWTLGHELLAAQAPRYVESRGLETQARACPNNSFPTRDGEWVALTVADDKEWRRLCELIGEDDPAGPLCYDRLQRHRSRETVESLVRAWTKGHDLDDAEAELQAAGLRAHRVVTTDMAHGSVHMRERGCWQPIAPLGGSEFFAMPWRRAGETAEPLHVGSDGHAARQTVFGELLGMSADEIEELQREGVVG
jgi:crotonobetainyl-CoA:carnitine CoA-transferase CaiB-like acyl-CoA transferase